MAFLMALSEVLSQLDFLILDEPTTHLDENRRKELVNVLEIASWYSDAEQWGSV